MTGGEGPVLRRRGGAVSAERAVSAGERSAQSGDGQARPLLGPRQQFPAETAFDGLRIVDRIVQIIGAFALADDPAPHLGSEPYGFLAHRISSSGVGTYISDYIDVSQRLELSCGHGDRLPRLRLHRLIP